MKVTDWVRTTLAVERRVRQCLRECKTITGLRHSENPMFIYCSKHDVWMPQLYEPSDSTSTPGGNTT